MIPEKNEGRCRCRNAGKLFLAVFLTVTGLCGGAASAFSQSSEGPRFFSSIVRLNGSPGSGDTLWHGARTFGPFLVAYVLTEKGARLDCALTLNESLVGLATMNRDQVNYNFDVRVNNLSATGGFQLQLYPPDQVSTLEASFFVVTDKADTIRFKGTVTGWYVPGPDQ